MEKKLELLEYDWTEEIHGAKTNFQTPNTRPSTIDICREISSTLGSWKIPESVYRARRYPSTRAFVIWNYLRFYILAFDIRSLSFIQPNRCALFHSFRRVQFLQFFKMKVHFVSIALLPLASAHTIFSNLYINGKDASQTVGVRYKTTTPNNQPLEDLSSNDLACNVGGDKGVAGVLDVPAGANLTFEFKASLWDSSKPRLEPGHKGPCAVYLKKVDSAKSAKGSGDGWFKILEDGVNKDGEWCTTRLTPTGKLETKLPEGLAPGEYLAKPELLALHNALEGTYIYFVLLIAEPSLFYLKCKPINKGLGRPQFFTSCMQIRVTGSGNLVPESTVSIPGYIKKTDKSVTFNIYSSNPSTYILPGPKIAKLISAPKKVRNVHGRRSEH